MTLKQQYSSVVLKYTKAFCKKHDIEFEYWAGGDIGTIAFIADYFFNFDDMRFDIDEDIPVGKITEWYNEGVENAMENKTWINYKNWLKISIE